MILTLRCVSLVTGRADIQLNAAISNSILLSKFLPSILSSLSCLKPSGKFSHLLDCMMGVAKKSEHGAWEINTVAFAWGECLTATNLSPLALARRQPAAEPNGSMAPLPRKQEEASTCQPHTRARAWTPDT